MKPKQKLAGLRPAVFRKAAKILSYYWDEDSYGTYTGCCSALDEASPCNSQKYTDLMEKLFMPPIVNDWGFWWSSWRGDEKDREARILALLLAALIAEEGL